MQFAPYTSETPVTLTQSQGHQIYNDNVDLEQSLKDIALMMSEKKPTFFFFF